MKIQFKIALLFTALCASVMIALSCAVYFFANEKAFEDFYVRLQLRATISAKANLDSSIENTATYEQVRYQHLQQLPEEKEYIIRIDTLARASRSILKNQLPQKFYNQLLQQNQSSYRKGYEFYKGIVYYSHKGAYIIIVSAVHMYARNFLNNLKTILITTNIISIVVFYTIGLIFSRRILAPIRKITKDVNTISATSLHKRVHVANENDEVAELATTFNNMLSRLETSFETQNNFVSNASHELNTPLTSIIGEAEYSLMKTRTPEQYQQGMRVILMQGEKLKSITSSLLKLAQSGFTGNLSLESIRVNELVHQVEVIAKNFYPDCHIFIDRSLLGNNYQDQVIYGNFQLLELCLSNILLNACKYSKGNDVTFALAFSEKYVIFIIKDRGIGIPEADMPHIFDPFFRASNVNTAKGYGIGLPLAQNIIKLHKGDIRISSREAEGTEVVVKIPRELR